MQYPEQQYRYRVRITPCFCMPLYLCKPSASYPILWFMNILLNDKVGCRNGSTSPNQSLTRAPNHQSTELLDSYLETRSSRYESFSRHRKHSKSTWSSSEEYLPYLARESQSPESSTPSIHRVSSSSHSPHGTIMLRRLHRKGARGVGFNYCRRDYTVPVRSTAVETK